MNHQDIIAHLCLKYPPEVIHEITIEFPGGSVVSQFWYVGLGNKKMSSYKPIQIEAGKTVKFVIQELP